MSIFTASLGLNSQTDNMWFTIKYIVVATLFLCVLWFISRWLVQQKGSIQKSFVKKHHTTHFANGKYLSVVEVDGVYYVIATDKNNITLIDKREQLNLPNELPENGKKEFKDMLSKIITKQGKKEENKDDGEA